MYGKGIPVLPDGSEYRLQTLYGKNILLEGLHITKLTVHSVYKKNRNPWGLRFKDLSRPKY